MTLKPEWVRVRRLELEQLLEGYQRLSDAFEVFARERFEANALTLRLRHILELAEDPDKTPVRPPSSDAVALAFKNSSEFEPRSGMTEPGGYRVTPKKPDPR